MFSDNKGFYPTPSDLIARMWTKIPKQARYAANYLLEPSAGSGNIIEYIQKATQRYHHHNIHAIERDERLISILRGKKITVVDYDFLSFNGPDKYDIIIANPPFDNGHYHLLKALDIMYSGHIVFLLNAETIRNPHSNARKDLVNKLNALGAEIEYLTGEFEMAERKTSVEVALIYIHIDRKIEQDLFNGVTQAKAVDPGAGHEQREVAERDSIRGMVADYNRKVEIGTRVLMDFYKNYYHIFPYMKLLVGDEEYSRYAVEENKLTDLMKNKLNGMLVAMRRAYWRRALELDTIRKRMTSKKLEEFEHALNQNALMDFTENNIRVFILNLIKSYEYIMTDAVVMLFDKMSASYAWDENLHNDNVHYFNGWKTNKAFYVNKKIVLPYYHFWCDSSIRGNWNNDGRSYDCRNKLNDIDIVMSYFSGQAEYYSIYEALGHAFARGETRNIESSYFKISVFKKGTMHLTFLDDDILRRFNVTACRGKGWLPYDYGHDFYETLDQDHRAVIDAFEGREAHDLNVQTGHSLFRSKPAVQIGCDDMTPVSNKVAELVDAINRAMPESMVKAVSEKTFEIINGSAQGKRFEAASLALGKFRKQLTAEIQAVGVGQMEMF